MLILELRLDYSEVCELAKLACPELVPLEKPTEDLLQRLEETVKTADDIYYPSRGDALLAGVFLFEQAAQEDNWKNDFSNLAYSRGITLFLEGTNLAIIGLSTETLLVSSELALFVMLHEMSHLAGVAHDDDFILRFSAQLESYADYKQISQVPE